MAANHRHTIGTDPARVRAVADAVERYGRGERPLDLARELGIDKSAFNYWVRKAEKPKHYNGTIPFLPCQRCGTTFQTPNHKRRKRFCSEMCRQANTSDTHTVQGAIHSGDYLFDHIPEGHHTRPVVHHGRIKKRQYTHILAAERALGRALRSGEVVHHINGDKHDNRNANLLVCDRSYHTALHQRMSLLYQREHFAGRA